MGNAIRCLGQLHLNVNFQSFLMIGHWSEKQDFNEQVICIEAEQVQEKVPSQSERSRIDSGLDRTILESPKRIW